MIRTFSFRAELRYWWKSEGPKRILWATAAMIAVALVVMYGVQEHNTFGGLQ